MELLIGLSILILVIGLLAFLIWWLIIETEGTFLGERIVIWLYDYYADRYDGIKQQDTLDERLHLAQPIMLKLQPHTDPLILDLGCGTGRLSLTLSQYESFEGYIIGLDQSEKMLAIAQPRLEEIQKEDSSFFIQASLNQSLPFPDNSFDFVACLEVLEFLPDYNFTLSEAHRVLRPGGLLLTTLRLNTRKFFQRVPSQSELQTQLEQIGFKTIEFELWQYDYEKVWAQKVGESDFIGVRMVEEILQCPRCQSPLIDQGSEWLCQHCGAHYPAQNTYLKLSH